MKNPDRWKPSKFIFVKGKLVASRNKGEVSNSSRFVVDLVAAQYQRYLSEHVSGRLVDLGCGKAPLYGAYRPYVTECICVDWPGSIHENQHMDQTCDLNIALPFESKHFNTIILSDVLEHIFYPMQLWNEMFRILQPGGKLIMNVPFLYKLHETPHDYFRYTKFALKEFASTSGFETVQIDEIGGLPEVFTDLASKFFYPIPVVGSILSNLAQYLGKVFLKVPFGNRLSRKTSEDYPLGYFMIVRKPT